jgi:hypothetical protein
MRVGREKQDEFRELADDYELAFSSRAHLSVPLSRIFISRFWKIQCSFDYLGLSGSGSDTLFVCFFFKYFRKGALTNLSLILPMPRLRTAMKITIIIQERIEQQTGNNR